MFHNHLTAVSSVLHGLFDINTSFGIAFLLKQNPGVSIQISRILRFCLYGLVTHFLGFIQIGPFYRQIVSIVVERTDVVRIINQRRIIGCISFCFHFLRMVQIS